MTQDATQFSVTVPTVLPVDISATGVVTVANDNKIINHSFGPVEVKSVSVQSLGDWKLVDFDTNFKNKKVGLHEYGFQMNHANVQPDGSCAAVFDVIQGNGQISFVYDSKVATQNTALSKENIANVVFTIGWSDKNATSPQLNATHKPDKAKMDAALKNLTGKITFATTAYQGEDGIDISENGDGSVMAVVDGQDATVYSEGGVLGINTVNYSENDGMFSYYNTKELDLHGLDTRQMTNMCGMFISCKNLKNVNISSFDTCNVVNMYRLFFGCNSLEKLNLSNFDTRNVTDMSGMFTYCDTLKSVDLTSFNTSKVTDMGGMFYGCQSLVSIDLHSFDTSNVTDMARMFDSCRSLTSLDLSSFDVSKITSTFLMFYECFNLKTCYGRTKEDCDKLNRDREPSGFGSYISTGIPSNVHFIVKPVVA